LNTLVIAGVVGNRWVEIPSLLDANSLIDSSPSTSLSGSITSLEEENLNDYSALTLALKSEGAIGAGEIEVMEGFTPNNDGMNDTWLVYNIERFPNAQIQIYNRLGNLVFSALDGYDNSWRGNFNTNSESLPPGPYFYTIDLDADGNIDRQGWFYINY
jgi:gliding motility-associated-like protein